MRQPLPTIGSQWSSARPTKSASGLAIGRAQTLARPRTWIKEYTIDGGHDDAFADRAREDLPALAVGSFSHSGGRHRSGRPAEGVAAIGRVCGLVVTHILVESAPACFDLVVGERAQRGVVALAADTFGVVRLVAPSRAGQSAERSVLDSFAEGAAIGHVAGDGRIIAPGALGDRGLSGMTLRGVRRPELLAYLVGDPGCKTRYVTPGLCPVHANPKRERSLRRCRPLTADVLSRADGLALAGQYPRAAAGSPPGTLSHIPEGQASQALLGVPHANGR